MYNYRYLSDAKVQLMKKIMQKLDTKHHFFRQENPEITRIIKNIFKKTKERM